MVEFRRIGAILATAILALLFACENPVRVEVAGGASETEATVAGRVLRSDGTPAPGATVRLRPSYFLSDTGAPGLPKGLARTRGDAVTDADGYFRFDSVFLGNYAIEAADVGRGGARLEASVNGNLDRMETGPVVLAPLSELRGRIVLPPGSKGAAYVRVYGLDRSVKADSLGRFTLSGMPAGSYDIKVTPTSPAVSPRSVLGVLVPGSSLVDVGEIALAPSLDAEDYSAWGDSARLTVNTLAAGVTGMVTGFPLLVRLDRSNFDFTASTGLDLRFANGHGRPLPYEIEHWDPLLGKAEIWVRVDTLRGGDSSQSLILHWNRPGVSGRSEGPAVFDSTDGWQGAWHLVRDPSNPEAAFRDASSQGNDAFGDGLDSVAPASGISHLGQPLNGADQALHTSKAFVGPDTFTLSLWFRTTTTAGGKLAGFGSYQTGASVFNDRHIWMDGQGRIHFGVYPAIAGKPGDGETRILSTTRAYNDDAWHHVAARLSAEGQALFLDGEKVATDPNTKVGFPYSGFWRIGYDQMGTWDNMPRSNHFRGVLDEIRVTQTAWSDDFIRLSYESQKPGSTLISRRP